MKLSLLLTATLLCLTNALGATINFKDITSTNVVKTNDLLLVNANLGGGSFATRTVTVADYKSTGGASAGGDTVWTNVSGTIKPASGQTTNRLQFISGAADNLTNLAVLVETANPWTDGQVAAVQNGGSNIFQINVNGGVTIGRGSSGQWGSSDSFTSFFDTTLGDPSINQFVLGASDGGSEYNMVSIKSSTGAENKASILIEGPSTGVRLNPLPSADVVPFYFNSWLSVGSVNLVSVDNNGTNKFGVTFDGRPITQGGTAITPANASAVGTAGTILWDSGFIYVCVAANTWKRVAIATW